MKKLVAILFILGVVFVSASMFVKTAEVEEQPVSVFENSDLGYSDIPKDNGL